MSKMAEFETEIREIVRDEINKKPDDPKFFNPQYSAERTKLREGESWSYFESNLLVGNFYAFCADQGMKTGRSLRSISCKIRNLMRQESIRTW